MRSAGTKGIFVPEVTYAACATQASWGGFFRYATCQRQDLIRDRKSFPNVQLFCLAMAESLRETSGKLDC